MLRLPCTEPDGPRKGPHRTWGGRSPPLPVALGEPRGGSQRVAAPRPGIGSASVLVVAFVLLLFGPTVGPTNAPAVSAATTTASQYESDVITYANAERAERRLTPVARSSCLDRFATGHVRLMAEQRTLFHQDMGVILTECGLAEVGENVAFGYPDGLAATGGWMDSAEHRANLLNRAHRSIGVSTAQTVDGSWYAVQLLGSARAG